MAEVVAPVTEHERPIGFLGLMRNRNYGLLWWGQLVSEMGNRFHWVAISLWVYSATGSTSAVSMAISSMFVGGLAVSLWAGVLVDKFNRKTILVVSDMVRALLVAAIPKLMGINIWLVYADLALVSIATAFFRPSIFAVLPQVVARRNLLSANSFFSAMDTGTEIVGPAAAGILAFTYGYPLLLYIDAATYAVSAFCILSTSGMFSEHQETESSNLRSIWGGMLEGMRYIRQDHLQWGLFVLMFPTYLVGSGLNALQTPLAKGVVGISDVEFGTFQSVWGVGFLVASLILGWFGSKFGKGVLILGGYLLAFVATAAMGLSESLRSLMVTAFAVGFANTLYYIGLGTFLMEYTPQRLIGRVFSIRQVALYGVRVLAPLAFGAFAEFAGIRQAIVTLASVGLVGSVLVLAANPVVRKLDGGSLVRADSVIAVWRAIAGHVDSQYEEVQQHILNWMAVLLGIGGWLGLFYRAPYHALGLLGAMTGLGYVSTAIRRKGLLARWHIPNRRAVRRG